MPDDYLLTPEYRRQSACLCYMEQLVGGRTLATKRQGRTGACTYGRWVEESAVCLCLHHGAIRLWRSRAGEQLCAGYSRCEETPSSCHCKPTSQSRPRLWVLSTTCRYDLPEAKVKEAVASALQLVNMQDYMYRATHTLSGGQRQRVAIAGERRLAVWMSCVARFCTGGCDLGC